MAGSIRGHVLAIAVVLTGAGTAMAKPASESPDAWAFRKPVSVPTVSQPTFVELRLDGDVGRDALPTLADLRLRDDTGAEVGYALRRRERLGDVVTRETAMLALTATREGAVRFMLDAGPERRPHSRVRLSVREQVRNFRVPVRVEVADESREWRLVREAGFIYRVDGVTKTADTSVSYPPTTARWVRLTVGPERGQALPLAGAAILLGDAAREEERVTAAIVERDAESMRRTTRVVLDLKSRRPSDRVELDLAEPAFQRVVLVEAGDDRKSWRWMGSGSVSAVDVAGIRERLTSIRFPEATARYLRVTIQNLDDEPLTVKAARVFAVKRSVVFEAAPGRTYVLDYGNPAAQAPREDARALPYLDDRLPTATLGATRPVPAPPQAPWVPSQFVATWATMAMAGLALGSLGWRMARGLRTAG